MQELTMVFLGFRDADGRLHATLPPQKTEQIARLIRETAAAELWPQEEQDGGGSSPEDASPLP